MIEVRVGRECWGLTEMGFIAFFSLGREFEALEKSNF